MYIYSEESTDFRGGEGVEFSTLPMYLAEEILYL